MPSPCAVAPKSLLAYARSGQMDPFVYFGFTNAWRAEDATDNGSVTTGFPSYVGASLTLPAQGTGQAIKAVNASLNGRMTVTCDGVAATGCYGAVALAGAPTSFTIATVARIAATNSGLCALTTGGTINTGVAQFHLGTAVRSRKVTTDALSTLDPLPANVVIVSVFTASGVSHYANRYTAITASLAGALAGTTFHLWGLAGAGSSFVLNGAGATSGFVTRALSSAEIAATLLSLGTRYGVSIAA